MHDVITIGDTKLDTFIVLPRAGGQSRLDRRGKRQFLSLEYGAKIPVQDFAPQIAGSAPNVAVGLARLGHASAVYTVVGDDAIGHLARERFAEERVDQRYVALARRERSSSSVVLMYGDDRTILAAHQPHAYRLPRIAPTKVLYISELGIGYVALFRDVVRAKCHDGPRIAFNPGAVQLQHGIAALRAVLKVTEVLFVNVEEARMLLNHRTRALDLRHVLSELWRLGPKTIVLTDGTKGAYAFDGGEMWRCPVFPTRVVEMTGAGDSFAAAFLAAQLYGKPIHDALRWGAANAASVVAQVGPQPGLLTKTQMTRVLAAHKRIIATPL